VPATAVLAWGCSALALVALDLPGTSALALVLVPWVALAGLPLRRTAAGGLAALATLGLALPVIGLAAAQDVACGASAAAVTHLAVVGALLVIGQAAAAAFAARSGEQDGGRGVHGALWCALVPLPALASAAALLGATGPEPTRGVLRGLLDAAPLAFVTASARAGALAEPRLLDGGVALLLVALLLWVGHRDGGREPAAS
jgi:hypothetical protein